MIASMTARTATICGGQAKQFMVGTRVNNLFSYIDFNINMLDQHVNTIFRHISVIYANQGTVVRKAFNLT